jgi:hypothetical protein
VIVITERKKAAWKDSWRISWKATGDDRGREEAGGERQVADREGSVHGSSIRA